MGYVSIDNVVANAYTICDGATDADQVFMRQWVFLGNKELGYSKEDVKEEKVYVSDLSIKKPEDFVIGKDFYTFDSNNKEISNRYVGYGNHSRERIDPGVGSIVNASRYATVTEDASHFHLSSDSSNISYAVLRYYAIPQDENGMPLILERKRYALMLFVKYMWAMRVNRNQSEVQQTEYTWLKEAKKQRAKNKMPTVQEANSIAKWYMNLITAPSPIKY